MTTASTAKVSIGGSLALNFYTNVSEARIERLALINQNPDTRFTSGDQGVEVKAATGMSLISIVGIAGLSLNIAGRIKSLEKLTDGKKLESLTTLVNPFGAEGDKGGIGVSFLFELFDNTTTAVIEGGARVASGADGVAVSAGTTVFDLGIAYAGGKGSSFAVSGAFPVAIITNVTTAQVGSGVEISGGSLTVGAHDDLTRIGIAGGVAAGQSVGVGVSAAINIVSRSTSAFVGTAADAPAGDAQTSIGVDGDVTIVATSEGDIWAFAVAGSFVQGEKDPKQEDAPDAPATDPDLGGDDEYVRARVHQQPVPRAGEAHDRPRRRRQPQLHPRHEGRHARLRQRRGRPHRATTSSSSRPTARTSSPSPAPRPSRSPRTTTARSASPERSASTSSTSPRARS